MKKIVCLLIAAQCLATVFSQTVQYPYPVSYMRFNIEGETHKMAYMDLKPRNANGQNVLLFHGKNFNGFYWKDVIAFLSAEGYRVVVPDQLGFGKSDKPDIHYSFALLALNTKKLLDSLNIQSAHVIGHSMGGMLATRFALMFPKTVQKLIYENPIGLEDYRTFVPFRKLDEQYAEELRSDYNSLKKYQQSYYPEWKPEYEQYVAAQYSAMQVPDFRTAAFASALTYEMIWQQPVVYEFQNITQSTLIIIGQLDRTIVGKRLVAREDIGKHGLYPELGKMLHKNIRGSVLVELQGVGHIPHIQSPEVFKGKVLRFFQ